MDNEQSAKDVSQAQAPESEEQLIPQSQVNKIVGRTRQEAAEHARRELQAQHQKEMEALRAEMSTPNQEQMPVSDPDVSQATSQPIDTERMKQELLESIAQEQHQAAIEAEGRRAAQAYEEKMPLGRENYDDFDSVARQFDTNAFPSLVYLMHDIPNAADIVYHLGSNPSKAGTLDYVAQRSPQSAKHELLRLAESLENDRKAKVDAKNNEIAPPLDRFQPSLTSSSNGAQTVSDMRRQLKSKRRR